MRESVLFTKLLRDWGARKRLIIQKNGVREHVEVLSCAVSLMLHNNS